VKRNAYRILVRNPAGKRRLEVHRRKGGDIFNTYLREIGWGGMD
jgi:hypothetical protein